MATSISNGESGLSVRTKLNDIWHSLDLNEYNKDITDDAVDVFVYYTSKDSDGGAWRKRTQGTSWYNETLNTSTRGSRKEFPAVAVIVAESNQVTIYDGDDPDLPMWMVFNQTVASEASEQFWRGAREATGVFALNGMLVFSSSGNSVAGVQVSNFASDELRRYSDTSTYSVTYSLPVSGRNSTSNPVKNVLPFIISQAVNDVAMTVLPNAPIDASTGLPTPTIAVATDGGVSVIKDDGTVADLDGLIEANNNSGHVALDTDGKVWFTSRQNSAGFYNGIQYFGNVSGTTDASVADDLFVDISRSAYASAPYFKERNTQMLSNAWAGNYGLTKVAQDYTNRDATMFAEVASDYNTGWQVGDIKLATLSDTDATNVTGSELVTNGTFDTDVSGWTPFNTSTIVYSSGQAFVTSDGSYGAASQAITTEVGKTYVISLSCTFGSSNGRIRVGSSDPNTSNLVNFNGLISGDYSFTFVATTTTTQVTLGTAVASGNCTFDNVSVRLAEEDRSVNGKGLQVFGTVTKSAVATGADLVGYSGWTANDFLEQPYNSDLNFGNDDFCTMGWFKTTDTYFTIFENRDNSSTNGWGLFTSALGSGNRWRFFLENTNADSSETSVGIQNTWTHFAVLRRGAAVEFWLNGDNFYTSTSIDWSTKSASKTEGSMKIGCRRDGQQNLSGSMALLRISATAPSPEQIKKIYEDEKVLFQENAQATLYGSSDAVTALAYDDTTELLHVGTSTGRSSFQGLRRVDNTTDAITAAISASNGLVAEE